MKIVLAVGLLLFNLMLAGCDAQEPSAKASKWHVLTALPLFLGEGNIDDVLSGASGESPLITRLSENRQLVPLDTLGGENLREVSYLLAVQPARLPPEELVKLDEWVRGGGRAVILADPDLVWPVSYAVGDSRAPPQSTLLDPLFTHWALTLDGQRGVPAHMSAQIAGERVTLVNPGQWRAKDRNCVVSDQQLVAVCRLGKGKVILLADADIADPRLWSESGEGNFRLIESLIERLEEKRG
jgi:hypothetical protein